MYARPEFYIHADIQQAVLQIVSVLESGIFDAREAGNPLVRSAFVDLMVCLRDLLAKAERLASRVSFDDDVIADANVRDIHDLVKYMRDAACHPDSWRRRHPTGTVLAFNIGYSKGWMVKVNGMPELGNKYDDDVVFGFGGQQIYLNRHIRRAAVEAIKRLAKVVDRRFALPMLDS